ncbi:MAG: helix-turn-helix transcriptional regulator [Planctomycetota bacterium]
MTNAREIIAELEIIRMRRGLTQAEVCKRMGVSRTWISVCQNRADSGKKIKLTRIGDWANALNCELRVAIDESSEFAEV